MTTWRTFEQTLDRYPVLNERLLRRLVAERRIAFSKCGRRLVFADADIEFFLNANRVEAVRQ